MSKSLNMMGKALLGVGLFTGLLGACGETTAGGDSETHFLATCTDKCGGGLSCICGVCTKPCDDANACGGLSEQATCEASCSGDARSVCDVGCERDAECSSLGASFSCVAGHCRADAGPTGSAGNAGSAPGACEATADLTPTAPSPTELDPDQVARAAAVLGSCLPDDGVARNAAEIWHGDEGAPELYFRFGTQIECLAQGQCGCDAIEQCLGFREAPPSTACEGGCNGSVWTFCWPDRVRTIDCSRQGLSCDDAAGCVAEPAEACDGGATCTADGEVRFCDNNGFTKTAPCASLGYACVDGACVGAGPACDGGFIAESEIALPTGTSCDGDTLIGCLRERETTTDCTARGPGFGCRTVGTTFFCGLAAECVPSDVFSDGETPTCDGSVVTFCNAGRVEHLDCTELGFTGCEIDSSNDHYGCTPGPTATGE